MLQPMWMMTFMMAYLIEQAEVTNKTVIYGLVTAVLGLCGVVMAMAAFIRSQQDKIGALYESRISDLKEAHDLVDTLMEVVGLKTKKKEGP